MSIETLAIQQKETVKVSATNAWIQTHSKVKFYPLNPDPHNIYISDIAHSLSMQCRYNGHTNQFYSVAQHCVSIAEIMCETPLEKIVALLHDASEAYLGDIAAPLKNTSIFAEYRKAEEYLQTMILDRFVPESRWNLVWPKIMQMDKEMFHQEIRNRLVFSPLHPDFIAPIPKLGHIEIDPWPPSKARTKFLSVFQRNIKLI